MPVQTLDWFESVDLTFDTDLSEAFGSLGSPTDDIWKKYDIDPIGDSLWGKGWEDEIFNQLPRSGPEIRIHDCMWAGTCVSKDHVGRARKDCSPGIAANGLSSKSSMTSGSGSSNVALASSVNSSVPLSSTARSITGVVAVSSSSSASSSSSSSHRSSFRSSQTRIPPSRPDTPQSLSESEEETPRVAVAVSEVTGQRRMELTMLPPSRTTTVQFDHTYDSKHPRADDLGVQTPSDSEEESSDNTSNEEEEEEEEDEEEEADEEEEIDVVGYRPMSPPPAASTIVAKSMSGGSRRRGGASSIAAKEDGKIRSGSLQHANQRTSMNRRWNSTGIHSTYHQYHHHDQRVESSARTIAPPVPKMTVIRTKGTRGRKRKRSDPHEEDEDVVKYHRGRGGNSAGRRCANGGSRASSNVGGRRKPAGGSQAVAGATTGSCSSSSTPTKRSRMSTDSETDSTEKRSLHNNMERMRRIDLRRAFDELRSLVPSLCDTTRAAKVIILRDAKAYCDQLAGNSKTLASQVEILRKEQEQLRSNLSKLRRHLASKHLR